MPVALVLDGHSRAALEATQSLGRSGVDVCVTSSDLDPLAFSSRYATSRLSQPPAVPAEGMIEWLLELDARHGFQLIIPSTETSLQAFLTLPDDSPLRRRAVLPSTRSLASALDREVTRKLASELGVPVPATRLIDRLPAVAPPAAYPVVLKPTHSKSVHRGKLRTYAPVIVQDSAAWSSVIADWVPHMPVLEQEYFPGWGVGVEMLYRDGKPLWYFAHERLHEWPLTGGASTYRRAIEPPVKMLDGAKRILDALQWHGVAMVEFKRRSDGAFALMEINPRLWGSLALSVDAGVNFPLALWKIATHEDVGAQPAYRRGLRTRHISADVLWQKANFFADRSNPLLLTRPRALSALEPLLALVGRERWDHFSWSDPGPMLHELRHMLGIAFQARERHRRRRALLKARARITRLAVERIATARGSRIPSIVFLCQGNICRSPFAALLARRRLDGVRIHSAGFDPRSNRATPPNVASEAALLGYDMSACRSQVISQDLLRDADLICLMDLSQYEELAKQFPDYLEQAVPLGLFADPPVVEIQDPDRKDAQITRRTLKQISSAVDRLAEQIGADQGADRSLDVATQ